MSDRLRYKLAAKVFRLYRFVLPKPEPRQYNQSSALYRFNQRGTYRVR